MMNKIKLFLKVCYLFITKQIVTNNDIADSYNKVSEKYNSLFLKDMHQYNDRIIDICFKDRENKDNLWILDLACGTGYNSKKVSELSSNSKYVLVDNSKDMIEQAKLNTIKLDATYKVADMIKYLKKAEDNSFDIIICNWALKYQKIDMMLSLAYKKLKKNGHFICIVNTKDTLKEIYPIYIKLLENNILKINKLMMLLPNPKNESEFVKWFIKHNYEMVYSSNNKHEFYFSNSQELANFITNTGALAGFDKMIDLRDKEITNNLVNEINNNNLDKVIHRFVMGVFKKRG